MTPLPNCEYSQGRPAYSNSMSKPRKKRRLLPSPSTSGSAYQEASHSAPETSVLRGRKRKRSWVGEEVHKRRKSEQIVCATARALDASNLTRTGDCCEGEEEGDVVHTESEAIAHWARFGRWPKHLENMSQDRRSSSPKKRLLSSSYTQQFKDGEVPEAHSPAYEKYLAQRGIFMEELAGRSRVAKESETLCTQLLRGVHSEPQYTAFPLSDFLSVWQRVQNRNEARIYRDITPLLVPSPELLCICGGHKELEHVIEEINTEWTKCKPLAGPKPKPDLAVGLSPSTFNEEEMAKLRNYTSFERATAFTDNLYFPFLLCEAKCGDQGINRADRQNMHSSSMAVNAIIQLYRALGEDKVASLNGQTLVYSVSHDNERVKLYGHLAVIEGDKETFYRYPIASFTLNFEENQGRKRTHDFVREVYRIAYPAHLKRIQEALAAMEDPQILSMTSNMSVEESEFKKPGTPASKKQKGELALLREQLAEQQKQNNEQLAEQQRQSKEQMALLERHLAEQQERQLAEQQKQNKEQTALLERQLAEQQRQSKEQMALLERQMAEQQRQNKEQLAEQQRQSKEQAEQYKEQIALLKQLLERR